MKIEFPSREFDDAVAAVCHGLMPEEQALALNELLGQHAGARDEYIFRLELHARLASEHDLFVPATAAHEVGVAGSGFPLPASDAPRSAHHHGAKRKLVWITGVAAGLAVVAAIGSVVRHLRPEEPRAISTSLVVPDSNWQPSVTNLPGQDYPRINSERRA
ncbi:MAG: hypothetical protein ABIO94_07240, partial [Opitutaceae bacterium]